MKTTHIYLCENSLEGILTAVYDAWNSGYGHNYNKIEIEENNYNQEFFSEYISVTTDIKKAEIITAGIEKKISHSFFHTIHKVSASYDTTKADSIYRILILGFANGDKVLNYLSNPDVLRVFELERNVGGEIHHYLQFLRFEELENGVLFGKINPKSDILPFISSHFEDRFPEENWIIADTKRSSVIIHQRDIGCSYTKIDGIDIDMVDLKYSHIEKEMQKLWKHFVKTIGIDSRKNTKLQQQMLPLRYRKYMNEFHS